MHKDSHKIRALNDRFRRGDQSVPGIIVATRGIHDLIGDDDREAVRLFQQVRAFNKFTADNDPHGEHDFGSFTFDKETCCWKIDVYDPSLEIAPLDPTDPSLSKRVLTIMLASEY
ncbi:DUF3768 domain-containing protein [Yoonia sp. GPGPB17]|uniref:DUF3768 domain-containing protein n=1 Tax=Yoonia sp. GPGPB17 TaxID=3026147 RepID=UPI0030BEC906